jgi:hypothetical protein
METLYIEGSRSTPEINFDPHQNKLVIWGQSYPENSFKFYEPILEWIDQYLTTPAESFEVALNIPYINSSSSKCLMDILEKLNDAYEEGKSFSFKWYCDIENESELECAEEFREDVTFPFEIIPLSGETQV